MAEVVGGLASVSTLLGVVRGLVRAILQARDAVRNAKQKTQQLLAKVESSQKCLLQISQLDPVPEVLDLLLRQLASDLMLALGKVQDFMDSNDRRQCCNQALAAAESFFGRGAAMQNKKTAAISEGLESSLAELDRHVLYFVATRVAATPVPPSSLPFVEHALVARMSNLAEQNEEGILLTTQVCKPGSSVWCNPAKISSGAGVRRRRPVIRLGSGMRGAREGGLEVPHSTKVRFAVSVDFGRWSFYVLTYDRWEDAEPQVFFPKSGNQVNNWVSSDSRTRRVFPNSQSQRGDPLSLKVERSRNTPDDEDGHVSVFLVLSTTPLHTDGAQQITIQDIEQHMDSARDQLKVKHVLFDVSKGSRGGNFC